MTPEPTPVRIVAVDMSFENILNLLVKWLAASFIVGCIIGIIGWLIYMGSLAS